MKYTYPSDKRPDTSEDVLSLGFISPSFDAVLVRVDSDPKMNNDYLQIEIVSFTYSGDPNKRAGPNKHAGWNYDKK